MHEVPECDGPYAWGVDHGIITTDLIERRARLALQAGNTSIAKPMIARLPATQALPLQQWVALLDTPLRTLDALLHEPDHDGAARSAARRLGAAGAPGPGCRR